MPGFTEGETVYNVRNVDYLAPYIREFIVVEQTPEDKKMSLITLAPVSHPSSLSLREHKGCSELSHTMAGASAMLNEVIDQRVQKLRDAIEELELARV